MTLTCFQAFDWISGLAKEVWVSEHVLVLHNEPKHGHLWIENIKVKALVPVRIQTVVHCSQENKKKHSIHNETLKKLKQYEHRIQFQKHTKLA